MLRVHEFLKHKEVEFHDLRTFDIDHGTADLVSRFLQSHIDIPDAVMKLEQIAIEKEYYTDFLKKYVSEEYCIQEEYSFTAIALLHYKVEHDVSLDDTITELITLSSKKTICSKCCSIRNDRGDAKDIIKAHNYAILCEELKRDELVSDGDEEPFSDYSNRTNDPSYKAEESIVESSSSSDDIIEEGECKIALPGQSQHLSYNPYDSSDDEFLEVKGVLNSTVCYNPYDETSDEDEVSKQPAPSLSKKIIQCVHCSKVFSNRFNMKLHLIGLVI